MAPNKNITHTRPSPCSRTPASELNRAAHSPYTEASTRHNTAKELLGPDLFNSLLFNRATVYENRAGSFASRPVKATPPAKQDQSVVLVIDTTEDNARLSDSNFQAHQGHYGQADQSGMVSRLYDLRPRMTPKAATGSKLRGRPAATRKTPTKKMSVVTTSKKRPGTPATNTRSTKAQKTEANSKKKVDTATTESPTIGLEVVDVSSDDEDENENRPHAIQEVDSEDEKPSILDDGWLGNKSEVPEPVTPQKPSDIPIPDTNLALPTTLDHSLKNELRRKDDQYATELQLLREQLEAAKADRRHLEKQISDLELAKTHSDTVKDAKYNTLEMNFRAVHEKLETVTQERDQIRIDLDNCKATSNELARDLQSERCLRQKEREKYEAIIKDITSSKSPSSTPPDLLSENARLRTENDRLRSLGLPSPSPSSISSSQDVKASTSSSQEMIKENNIRKTYAKVKRKFDNLHSIAVDLATCTRSMDMSSFGEFGSYLRQLKKALEEDAAERTGVVHAAKDEDDAK
jgi:chaperonin cofactor prefoldin